MTATKTWAPDVYLEPPPQPDPTVPIEVGSFLGNVRTAGFARAIPPRDPEEEPVSHLADAIVEAASAPTRAIAPHPCSECGGPVPSGQKVCSRQCAQAKGVRVSRELGTAGRKPSTQPFHPGPPLAERSCTECGTPFMPKRVDNVTCSRRCQAHRKNVAYQAKRAAALLGDRASTDQVPATPDPGDGEAYWTKPAPDARQLDTHPVVKTGADHAKTIPPTIPETGEAYDDWMASERANARAAAIERAAADVTPPARSDDPTPVVQVHDAVVRTVLANLLDEVEDEWKAAMADAERLDDVRDYLIARIASLDAA